MKALRIDLPSELSGKSRAVSRVDSPKAVVDESVDRVVPCQLSEVHGLPSNRALRWAIVPCKREDTFMNVKKSMSARFEPSICEDWSSARGSDSSGSKEEQKQQQVAAEIRCNQAAAGP